MRLKGLNTSLILLFKDLEFSFKHEVSTFN